jgi:hypothetical protein
LTHFGLWTTTTGKSRYQAGKLMHGLGLPNWWPINRPPLEPMGLG